MSFLRVVLIFVFLSATALHVLAQPERITAAVEKADWETARAEINKLRSSNETLFRDKNYDYLLGRIAERTGDIANANASYQTIVANSSKLREYATRRIVFGFKRYDRPRRGCAALSFAIPRYTSTRRPA